MEKCRYGNGTGKPSMENGQLVQDGPKPITGYDSSTGMRIDQRMSWAKEGFRPVKTHKPMVRNFISVP